MAEAPLKVLVAEDEPSMLSLLARHLRGQGFRVLEASEGDAAWDLARQHLPDLVVLDVMMPGMSGWEVCKKIRADQASFAHTGVIILTGIGRTLNEMTSEVFEADAWLNKPLDLRELDEKVRSTLARRAARRALARDASSPPTRGTGAGKAARAGAGEQKEVRAERRTAPSRKRPKAKGARDEGKGDVRDARRREGTASAPARSRTAPGRKPKSKGSSGSGGATASRGAKTKGVTAAGKTRGARRTARERPARRRSG